MKRIVLVAVCATLACLTALAVSVSASFPTSANVSKSASAALSATFKPQQIIGPRPPATGIDQNVVALGTQRLAMTANQTVYVVSALRANEATVLTLVDNEVRCTWPGGSKNLVMGQNIYAGTGANPQWENTWIVTKFLLHPGVATTATCTTYARVASLYKQPSSVQIAEGSLRFADTSVANAANGKPLDYEMPYGDLPVDSSPAHLSVRQPALPITTAPDGFRELSVFGDVNYTVCRADVTCNRKGASTAQFTLIINQWNKDGTATCHKDASTTVTKKIPYAVHHAVVPLYKPHFKVWTTPGCGPVFNAYVRVDWLGGEAGAVQGTAIGLPDLRGSTSTHRSAMSHLYIVPVT
ncbi:hypothetical protein E1293_30530 [Actinomadura darangshiensis]|uniref:Uncharacterized protein n=1 Tax=Actinomadura darangshiensis TaxID=705336 RepID=A0A4R5AL85_9ACTN|nr:hypothetical protein [Actinomadura darangshiensis]TDD73718.1 hypothetical protein E1293_30530 [Actinomadura darangshiensis]